MKMPHWQSLLYSAERRLEHRVNQFGVDFDKLCRDANDDTKCLQTLGKLLFASQSSFFAVFIDAMNLIDAFTTIVVCSEFLFRHQTHLQKHRLCNTSQHRLEPESDVSSNAVISHEVCQSGLSLSQEDVWMSTMFLEWARHCSFGPTMCRNPEDYLAITHYHHIRLFCAQVRQLKFSKPIVDLRKLSLMEPVATQLEHICRVIKGLQGETERPRMYAYFYWELANGVWIWCSSSFVFALFRDSDELCSLLCIVIIKAQVYIPHNPAYMHPNALSHCRISS